jgi:hypothetical protein
MFIAIANAVRGGSISPVQAIVSAYNARVLSDGGTIEGTACLTEAIAALL